MNIWGAYSMAHAPFCERLARCTRAIRSVDCSRATSASFARNYALRVKCERGDSAISVLLRPTTRTLPHLTSLEVLRDR